MRKYLTFSENETMKVGRLNSVLSKDDADYSCFIDVADTNYSTISRRIDNREELIKRSNAKVGKLIEL